MRRDSCRCCLATKVAKSYMEKKFVKLKLAKILSNQLKKNTCEKNRQIESGKNTFKTLKKITSAVLKNPLGPRTLVTKERIRPSMNVNLICVIS